MLTRKQEDRPAIALPRLLWLPAMLGLLFVAPRNTLAEGAYVEPGFLPHMQSALPPLPMQVPSPAGLEWENTPGSTWHRNADQYAIDFNIPGAGAGDEGILVLAAADGVVVKATPQSTCRSSPPGGYGCEVVLGHAYGYESRYAHLQEVLVQPGQSISQGTPLGLLGKTGNTGSQPHLHFALYHCGSTPSVGQPCPRSDLMPVVPYFRVAEVSGLVDGSSVDRMVSANYGIGYEKIVDPRDLSGVTLHPAFSDTYNLFGGQYWVFGHTQTPVQAWNGGEIFYQEFRPPNQTGLPWSDLSSALVENDGQVYFVTGPIWEEYKSEGGPDSQWGKPVSHSYEWHLPIGDGYRTDFDNGSIVWTSGGTFQFIDSSNADWTAHFFDQPDVFSGPSVQRYDEYIDFRWQALEPPGPVVTHGGFSAIWETTESALVQLYSLEAEVQGHLEIRVNGNLQLSIDSPDQAQSVSSARQITLGAQNIEVRFWQEAGKSASLAVTVDGVSVIPPAFASEGEVISGSSAVPVTDLAQYQPPPFPGTSPSPTVLGTVLPPSLSTATVLVFDTSGSMEELDASGLRKLEAAQQAGVNIVDIIQSELEAQGGTDVSVGIVDFSDTAQVDQPLTSDMSAARSALRGLLTTGGTGMADGLRLGIELLQGQSGDAQSVIILLSDGLPNVALGGSGFEDETTIRQQVLDLATQAGSSGICVHTVGFGEAYVGGFSLDEGFLRQVAASSGCGEYYAAVDALELANVYVKLRHATTGQILLEAAGPIAQGQQVDIGDVQVERNQSTLLYTLNWPGSRLTPVLIDPGQTMVDDNYPGASISTYASIATVIVNDPTPGTWHVAAQGDDVPEGTTTYNAVLSTRVGPASTTPAGATGPAIAVAIGVVVGGVLFAYSIVRRQSVERGPGGVPAAAVLHVVGGPLAGQTFTVPSAGLIIGRSSVCNVRLPDQRVSRQHAQIRFAQGAWFVQDMQSTGGTYVNGEPVQATRLSSGARIRVGSTELEFRLGQVQPS